MDLSPFLDLTSLAATDTEADIERLCALAADITAPCAAVCVFPSFVALATARLRSTSVGVASVVGGFPAGKLPLELKRAETLYAIQAGATEVDLALDRGQALSGRYEAVEDEVRAIVATAGTAHVKVILETCDLGSPTRIRATAEAAIRGGAHLLKTSTGRGAAGATLEGTRPMLEAIRAHHASTGARVGLKVAGGLRTPAAAAQFIELVRSELGATWLQPGLFRIGSSSVLR